MELTPIGVIHTPYNAISDCPRNVGQNEDPCYIEVFEPYRLGLNGFQLGNDIQLLYWLDQAEFSTLIQKSRKTGERKGVFALRTPNRPNPIGTAVVTIQAITATGLTVYGLDCLNGTPLLDIKPAFRG